MILLPMLLGQGLAMATGTPFSWRLCGFAVSFAVLFQIYLLYTNDAADAQIDRSNNQHWLSGGSRVIPEGKLVRRQLQRGALVTLVLLSVLCISMALFGDRPWMLGALLASVTLSSSYHHRPLRLSYRGYGEVAQGLGCGVLLPIIGYYLQRGDLIDYPWLSLLMLYGLFHAAHVITALPDYASDRIGGKRTLPVRRGQKTARVTAVVLLATVYSTSWLFQPSLEWQAFALMSGPSLLILVGVLISGLLYDAGVSNFPKCRRFVTWLTISQAWFLIAWAASVFLGGGR